MPNTPDTLLPTLLARLERIPADSRWAHRASGVRGSLLVLSEDIENGKQVPRSELDRLMERGFFVLEKAAKEKGAGGLKVERPARR